MRWGAMSRAASASGLMSLALGTRRVEADTLNVNRVIRAGQAPRRMSGNCDTGRYAISWPAPEIAQIPWLMRLHCQKSVGPLKGLQTPISGSRAKDRDPDASGPRLPREIEPRRLLAER
jgi:hypothetical protein